MNTLQNARPAEQPRYRALNDNLARYSRAAVAAEEGGRHE